MLRFTRRRLAAQLASRLGTSGPRERTAQHADWGNALWPLGRRGGEGSTDTVVVESTASSSDGGSARPYPLPSVPHSPTSSTRIAPAGSMCPMPTTRSWKLGGGTDDVDLSIGDAPLDEGGEDKRRFASTPPKVGSAAPPSAVGNGCCAASASRAICMSRRCWNQRHSAKPSITTASSYVRRRPTLSQKSPRSGRLNATLVSGKSSE